jgi:serine/threonine protein phosphatase PrpC
MLALAHLNLPSGRVSSDCAASFLLPDGLVLVLADGAGGTTHGREAARAVVDLVAHELAHGVDPLRIADVLRSIDVRLTRERAGQSTAVCVSIGPGSIVGASAGDSEAWIVDGDSVSRLTDSQLRKPLLGAGAQPRPFVVAGPLRGTLVVASDGLFGYVSEERVVRACALGSVEAVAQDLAAAAGRLQDDLSLFVVRASA